MIGIKGFAYVVIMNSVSVKRLARKIKMEGARKISPLQVRMPPELREWLKSEAAKNHRSLNSEIVARLETSKAETTANRGD